MKEHECEFCEWRKIEENEQYRWLEGVEDYYVILAREPKTMGHTLVVSKEHYPDITYLKPKQPATDSLLRAVVYWTKKLKNHLLSNDEHAKVYVMSICEHWSPQILRPDQKTTEHLHFHLLPRHKSFHNKELAAESFLSRAEDTENLTQHSYTST